jgi:hypothetical protein
MSAQRRFLRVSTPIAAFGDDGVRDRPPGTALLRTDRHSGVGCLFASLANESLMPTHTCVRLLCEAYGLGRTCVRHSSSR